MIGDSSVIPHLFLSRFKFRAYFLYSVILFSPRFSYLFVNKHRIIGSKLEPEFNKKETGISETNNNFFYTL